MPNLSLLLGLLAVLASAFLGGLLARKLRQPMMFGYLLGGLVVSSIITELGLKRETLSFLAEIGSALLMFTLGLEFSLKKIEKIKKLAIGGTALQIILTIAICTITLSSVFRTGFNTAFIMACAFSLSSTAIVVKILQEKHQLESLPGEIMESMLLVQDLAVLPLISILPIMFGNGGINNVLFMGKAILILALTIICSLKFIPKLTDFISSYSSRELLLIFVVTMVFLFALITANFGFSFALGAFLAGLILSQTSANHAIFSEIRPLRDVFLAIFFVSLGLSLDPRFLLSNIFSIVSISFAVIAIKVLVVGIILAFFKYHAQTIFKASFGLSQVGEFSFALAMAALTGEYFGQSGYSMAVSVTLLTMVLTPWLFSLADLLYQKSKLIFEKVPSINQRYYTQADQFLPLEELPFTDHVVILGYGRVGKWIGSSLDKTKLPYLVVEYNPTIVRQLKLEGKKVVFGDPTDISVLDFAQVDKAKLVVIAIPDSLTQKIIIANCHSLNPMIQIICRSHLEEDHESLLAMGVDHVIHPEFEAALSMSHRILQNFGLKNDEVNRKIKELKNEHESYVKC